jgi:hypothetical protein
MLLMAAPHLLVHVLELSVGAQSANLGPTKAHDTAMHEPSVRGRAYNFTNNYWSFAYSALAAMRMGMSGSASFQSVRKS